MADTWQPPTREDVLKAIMDSGYPLEVRVGRILDQKSYTVTPGWNYRDRDSGISKEIDVVAQRGLMASGVSANVHLLISCKLKRAGLVLFESAPPVLADGIDPVRQYVFGRPQWIFRVGSGAGYRAGDVLGWISDAWPPARVTANQFAAITEGRRTEKGKSWIANHGDLFEKGVLPLISGFQVYRQRHGLAVQGVVHLNFAALLLIVDGPLWCCRVGRSGTSLLPVSVGSFYRHYAHAQTPATYRIDVVRYSYLARYLAHLDVRLKTMEEKIADYESDIRYSASRPPEPWEEDPLLREGAG